MHFLRIRAINNQPDINDLQPVKPKLCLLFRAAIYLGEVQNTRQQDGVMGNFIPILGGNFSGPGINGEILPGGGDSQLVYQSGHAELNAFFMLKTDDGAIVSLTDKGLRISSQEVAKNLKAGKAVFPEEYYFRTHTRLETAAAQYQWLNQSIALGSGCKLPDKVRIDFYRIE